MKVMLLKVPELMLRMARSLAANFCTGKTDLEQALLLFLLILYVLM